MNIINDTFHKILDTIQGVFIATATNLYNLTGIEDIHILILITSGIIIIPIVYFVLNKYTEIYSWQKMSGLILFIVYIFIEDPKNNLDFIANLTEQAKSAASTGLVTTALFLINALMEEPYFEGLFGRFRDRDYEED